ncbi:MAG: hypothetical protein BIFFINMI_00384 [Phycisphaerae bacterium]|nr:hypothetical protein [Phycisphaerae bacterium]
MRWAIFATALAVVGWFCSACAPSGPAVGRIAVVRSIGQLQAQPRCRLAGADNPQADGPTVQLGVESVGCALHGGALLYVLASDYRQAGESREIRHDPADGPIRHRVGPVLVEFDGEPNYAFVEARVAPLVHSDLPSRPLSLYIYPIVGRRPGTWPVRVRTPDGQLLARTDFTVADKPDRPWTILRPSRQANEPQQRQPGQPEDLTVSHVTVEGSGFAAPRWETFGDRPFAMLHDVSPAKRPRGSIPAVDFPLPRFVPLDDEIRLHVTPRDSGREFDIASDEPFITTRPDWHFLVRIEVNGHPFLPRPIEAFGDANGVLILGRSLRLRVRILPSAIGARTGDSVSLQFLYSEFGWEFVDQQAELLQAISLVRETPPWPRLSNRVTFKIK